MANQAVLDRWTLLAQSTINKGNGVSNDIAKQGWETTAPYPLTGSELNTMLFSIMEHVRDSATRKDIVEGLGETYDETNQTQVKDTLAKKIGWTDYIDTIQAYKEAQASDFKTNVLFLYDQASGFIYGKLKGGAIQRLTLKPMTGDITVTTPGDFATIQEAIQYATEHYIPSSEYKFIISVTDVSAFGSVVTIDGINLSWIKIDGGGNTFTKNGFEAFKIYRNAVSPEITNMTLDGGDKSKTMFKIYWNSKLYIGDNVTIKNARTGIHLINSSTAYARKATFDSNKTGILSSGSMFYGFYLNFNANTTDATAADGGNLVIDQLYGGSTINKIIATFLGKIKVINKDVTTAEVYNGGFIASDKTITNTNIAKNTYTQNGVIFAS